MKKSVPYTNNKRRGRRPLSLLLLLLALWACCLAPTAQAAGRPTSFGLAEHGIMAHAQGWLYQYGGKGQVVNGVRVSDCAGLIYSYFSDIGVGGCMGGATSQVERNCVFSGTIRTEGIPNIHGLVLTMPDYNDPGSGIYGHIGIYIGDDTAVDNSDTTYNMRRLSVYAPGRDWNAWHLFDNGVQYPVSGWYAFDGKMVHYSNYEYDVNTTIDGIAINDEGFAVGPGGGYLPVDQSILSSSFTSASTVRGYLAGKYSGYDNTYELIYGGSGPDEENYNGIVTGAGVNLRAAASTASASVTVLHRGDLLTIHSSVEGDLVTSGGQSTSTWYSVTTASGKDGYICSLFATYRDNTPDARPQAPTFSVENGVTTIQCADEGVEIRFTTDGTEPTADSELYTGFLFETGCTYKAVAVKNGLVSDVSTATVLSSGKLFTDLAYGDWFTGWVDKAVTYHLFNGSDNYTFGPMDNIQRGQFVVVLANLSGADLSSYDGATGFTDVSPTAYYARAVQWAVENGFASGVGENAFRPTDPITREQMCVFIARFGQLQPQEGSMVFDDHSSISAWAQNAVYACRDAGFINGTGANSFNPMGTATRAEACVVTVKYYESLYANPIGPIQPAGAEEGQEAPAQDGEAALWGTEALY